MYFFFKDFYVLKVNKIFDPKKKYMTTDKVNH